MISFPPLPVLVNCLVVLCAGSFHLGYHEIIINPTFDIFQQLLNDSVKEHYNIQLSDIAIDWIWAFTTSSLALGEVFGCILLIPLSRRIGRVRGIAITNTILLLCIPLFVLSKNSLFELFVIGRFIAGIAIGIVMGLQALFLKEIGSVEYAGMINTFAALMLEVGANSAAVFGTKQIFGRDSLWQVLFYLLVPSLAISLLYQIFFAHETPFYLLDHGEDKLAKQSIAFYHSHKNESDREIMFCKIKRELKLYSNQLSFSDVLKLRPARNALFLSVAMNVAIIFTGVLAITFYGTEMIEKSGVDKSLASWMTVGVFSMALWTLLLSTCVVDRIARRTMVVGGCAAIAATNAAIVILLVPFEENGQLWLGITFTVILGLFSILYGLTIGNIAWFIAVELSAPGYANVVSSIAIAAQSCTAFVIPFIFYPLNDLFGAYSFLLFALPSLAFAVYFYVALPETLHRKLSDILLDLGATEEEVAVLNNSNSETETNTDFEKNKNINSYATRVLRLNKRFE